MAGMNTTALPDLLRRRGDADHAYRSALAAGDETTAAFRRLTLDELTRDVREHAGDRLDLEFRTALFTPAGGYETPFEARTVGATARGIIGGTTFVDAFFAKAVQAAPLLDWATVLPTSDGRSIDFGFLTTDGTANGVVTDGSTITGVDPGFNRAQLKAYAYKQLTVVASELLTDARLDLERLAAEHLAPLTARKLSTDLWGGGGTTEPEGLLAGLGTVTAAAAGSVSLTDVANLLAAVPAADRFGGDCVIMLSPGAYDDLLAASTSSALVPMTLQVTRDEIRQQTYGGHLFGVPFVVDTALDDPATTKKSVVAGNIAQAYAIRLAPLRVDVNRVSAASDTVSLRVVLRADGRRMRTAAAKALVHP